MKREGAVQPCMEEEKKKVKSEREEGDHEGKEGEI